MGRRRAARCRAALEALDDNHAAAATGAWRAVVYRGAGGLIGVVVLGRWIWRDWNGEQLPGARDVGLAAGAGEQPVVADAVKSLGQDVEQEAPDELVGCQLPWAGLGPVDPVSGGRNLGPIAEQIRQTLRNMGAHA